MNVEMTEEQKMLRDSVAKFLQNEAPLEKVRELADEPTGSTPELWQTIAEQGWLGVMVPEDLGGLGLGVAELAIVCEEMGRGVLPGPYLSTVLATHAIVLGGADAAKSAWIEKAVAGEARGALALLEGDGQLGASSVQLKAEKSADGYTLSGTKSLVADAEAAEFFIVAARTANGEDGTTLFVVDKAADGVSVAGNKLMDLTSRSGQLTLNGVSVGSDAVVGTVGQGWEIVEQVLLVANVCIAAGCVAGCDHVFKMTIGYAKERTQFGVLIGSFQAVKHPLARLFAKNESARSAYQYAAWAVDAKDPGARAAVAVARIACTEAFRNTTMDCLQAHGGIGFTWEYDLHLFMKRAKHNQYFLGEARDYEEVIATEALGI